MLTAGNSRVHSSCLAIDWDICTRPVVVFHLLSRVWLFMAPWTVAHQASLSSTISCSSNSCPLSQRCHPTISSSASLLSFCLQSFPASGNIICTCICTLYVHVKKKTSTHFPIILNWCYQNFQSSFMTPCTFGGSIFFNVFLYMSSRLTLHYIYL